MWGSLDFNKGATPSSSSSSSSSSFSSPSSFSFSSAFSQSPPSASSSWLWAPMDQEQVPEAHGDLFSLGTHGPEPYRELRMQLGTHGPKHMPDKMSDRMSEYISDKMPNRMPGGMSEYMSDRTSVGGDHSKQPLHNKSQTTACPESNLIVVESMIVCWYSHCQQAVYFHLNLGFGRHHPSADHSEHQESLWNVLDQRLRWIGMPPKFCTS